MHGTQRFNRSQVTEQSIAFELANVRKELEQEAHAFVQKEGHLLALLHDFHISINTSDKRWRGKAPSNPGLRISNGQAGIWSQPYSEAPELLFLLPELGEGMNLMHCITTLWKDYYLQGPMREDIQKRLIALELEVKDLHHTTETRKTKYGTYIDIFWTGTFVWNGKDISNANVPISKTTLKIPSEIGQEVLGPVPEIHEAYAQWAKDYLDQQDNSGAPRGGLLTTKKWESKMWFEEHSSKDHGGETYIDILLGDENIATAEAEKWEKIQHQFHFPIGEITAYTPRQIHAIAQSCNKPTSPGNTAMLHEMNTESIQHQKELADARADAKMHMRREEAKTVIQEIENANIREEARYQADLEQRRIAEKGAHIQMEAKKIWRSVYFRCLDANTQSHIVQIAEREMQYGIRNYINFSTSSTQEIREWVQWTEPMLDEARAARPAAEALAQREMAGEVLTNFSATIPGQYSPGHSKAWAIQPDGTVRKGDNENTWLLIQPNELAIAWNKAYRAAPNIFAVAKLPIEGITNAQQTTVNDIVKELAKEWDGATGFSGKAVSPPVGKGWDLSRVSYGYPAAAPEQKPTFADREDSPIEFKAIPQPKLIPIPTIETVVQEKIAQENALIAAEAAEKARIQKREEEQLAREAEFTPEIQEQLKKAFDELDVYLIVCTTLPQKSDEAKTFIKEINNNNLGSAGMRHLLEKGDLKKEGFEQCNTKIRKMQELAKRKKINDNIPNFWDKIQNRVEQWRSVENLVEDEILKGEDIALLLEEVIDGVRITTQLLVKRIARRFLADPWHISVEDAIAAETKALYSLLPS